MSADSRNKDKSLGWIVSVGLHIMLLLLFFLINAWKAPNPPHPEYGVELNIGIEEEGFGVDQPLTPPAEQSQPDEAEPQPQTVEPEPEPVEEQAIDEDIPDSKQEDSPVKAKPEVKPKPVEPVKENKKEEVKTAPPVETKPKVEAPKPDAKAMYPGGASQGTKQGQTGDAGSQQGTPDGKSLMGRPGGGGGGPTLEIAGWRWDREPKVVDPSAENGKLVFDIVINADGDITAIQARPSSFTQTVIQKYKDAVLKLTFSQIDDSVIPISSTKGVITFIIRSN